MRRTDKEITERAIMAQIINHAQVCRLGLAMGNTPYVLPVSFGFDGHAIYFHTATEGRKIVFLAANNRVCFEFEHGVEVIRHDSNPCKWSVSFQSVIGYGIVAELTTPTEKIDGLNHIMHHYSGRTWPISATDTDDTRVWRIAIESLTGKQSKDKADTRWLA
jgi:nitroimidazol reductase NimA-like FMN-containing flavoprotein (pyridoxamine 5'-phosphate oxidase superfamily)